LSRGIRAHPLIFTKTVDMQTWTDEHLQKIVDVCSKNDQYKASQILKAKPSSLERMMREAKARGITPAEQKTPPSLSPPKVLVIDIETSLMAFYAWSPGKQYMRPDQIITDWYTHSWAVKWLFEAEAYSDVQTPEESLARDDERIVRSMWEFLDHAEIVIVHNARFDIRKLNAKFIQYRLPPPSPYKIIDTLKAMRYDCLFSSNKQDELAKRLGFSPKMQHDGYDLWKRCYNGDPEALIIMEKYNKGDIKSLEELYVIIRPYIKGHPNMALFVEGDGHQCPNCGGSKMAWMDKFYYTTVNKYSCFRCGDCGAIGRSPSSVLDKITKPKVQSVAR
jgi:hypothetical protein